MAERKVSWGPRDKHSLIGKPLQRIDGVEKASGFVVRVMDVVGKTVYTETFSNMTAGAHTVTLNTNGYSAGVYTYSVTADDYTVTNRMVVR